MSSVGAFSIGGNTIQVVANSVAPTPVQVSGFGSNQPSNFLLSNTGNQTVYFGFGSSAAVAALNTVAPVSGTPTPVIPVAAQGQVVINAPPGTFFTAITNAAEGSGAVNCYITPGEGI